MKKHIGVLLSGRGSNFDALAASVAAGRIPNAEISIVVSNRETAQGIEKARARGIEARVIPSKGLEREAYDRLVVAALQEKNVDLVCLAGYMRLLSPYFVAAFPQRILNIHPSLLPAFPGLEPQRQALEHGAKFSGCTVHFVDENLDAGPIVTQAVVPIEDGDTPDTLAERILREEHRIYTEAVRIVLEGRYRIEGRRVLVTKELGEK
ncbi:MAG TPA: phosphoribosylglycinamide formyltransferase [Candidatus Acidoferrales bacterium]|nr:phosphoribosylglycinamide formyltransferase [Candidatus Acidoferrales bacterium]